MTGALGDTPLLSMRLLGGFCVERAGTALAASGWQRRSAKTLTKLLATCPGHSLHREQVTDILWPGAEIESAFNSLGKALHAARHAFEPELPRRQDSAYLRMTEAMVALNTEHVAIDVDHFEQLAKEALRCQDAAVYEAALAAYGGELLPEDRYADWCAERRDSLAELRVRLLLELAMTLEKRGACNEAAERLRAALTQDPTREDVHRHLMHLYAEMGTPDQAIRQFRLCQDVLRRELDLAAQPETVSLYHDIIANRVPRQNLGADRDDPTVGRPTRPGNFVVPDVGLERHPGQRRDAGPPGGKAGPPPGEAAAGGRPFVGREHVIQQLCDQLAQRTPGQTGLVVLTGEAGIGKTRLMEELAARAGQQGAAVLWSGRGAHARQFACGPFAVALEGYAASRPPAALDELAERYPSLARFVPSLRGNAGPASALTDYHLDVFPAIVRLLTDLGRRQPVLLVLNDLHDADPRSLDLVRYLAHLAVRQPWLMVAAVREEEVEAGSELRQLIEATTFERLGQRIELRSLSRQDCDQLVWALLPGVRVGEELLARIYHRSRGNPLFVEELVRQLSDPSRLASGTANRELPWPAPARVRTLVGRRLAGMDEILHRMLVLVAASGEAEISLGALRSAMAALDPGVPDAAVLDALDRALQLRVLEEGGDGFTFRHPLFRLAVFEGLSRYRRYQFQAALVRGGWDLPQPGSRSAGRGAPELQRVGVRREATQATVMMGDLHAPTDKGSTADTAAGAAEAIVR
jgi:DNA-binding SARP family transcriptional activator